MLDFNIERDLITDEFVYTYSKRPGFSSFFENGKVIERFDKGYLKKVRVKVPKKCVIIKPFEQSYDCKIGKAILTTIEYNKYKTLIDDEEAIVKLHEKMLNTLVRNK